MSYTKFFPIVLTYGRSSKRLPTVDYLRKGHCGYRRPKGCLRERTVAAVYTVTPCNTERPAWDRRPPNLKNLNRMFGRLDDIHDLAPSRVAKKTAAIYRKWCVKLWGVRVSSRYLKWTLSEVI